MTIDNKEEVQEYHFLQGIFSGFLKIRIQQGGDIFRIFCFFDKGQLVVLSNGFQKKSHKTPKKEIDKALKIKKEYESEEK